MDYAKELRKAERYLKQGEAILAAQTGGRILETSLRELYKELLPQLSPESGAKAMQALKDQGKGKTIDQLTLGQVLGVFREARLIRPAQEILNRDVSILENQQLVQGWLVLRNRAVHGSEDIQVEEIHAFLVNLRTLLQKARYIEPPTPLKGELPPWWKVARPHRDIREGKLDPARFAAKLDEVVGGRAEPEYQDPGEFARNTYLTGGLLYLLRQAQNRLSGQGGEGVIHLQTTFGGGKTHALIALYHFVRSPEMFGREFGLELLDPAAPEPTPHARVAAFVGTAADPLRGRTPWGDLAQQLGRYELVREHDERRISPGKDVLRRVLGEEPLLILIDEIAEYLVRLVDPRELAKSQRETARAYQSQVFAFLHELSELAASVPRCLLVITSTTSTPYGEESERVQQRLADIVGRMHRMAEPVHGEEVYEVVRQRLFEDLGDPGIHEQVAEEFTRMYRELGEEMPEEARAPQYRERLLTAYPFHPELIDVLYNQWGSFHEFQRTRGVLRFLAEVVAWQWKNRKKPAPVLLIRASDVPLEVGSIRETLIQPIGRAYDSVLASDITGGKGLARQVDRRLPEELQKHRLAEGLATAIFLYSFSGAEREHRGATLARLRVAMLQPHIPSTAIGDIAGRLEEELLYLHRRDGRYYFSTELNLNRTVVEAEEGIEDAQIRQEIRGLLEKRLGQEWPPALVWPSGTGDVPERRQHVLVVLGPDHGYGKPETEAFVASLFKLAGGTPRSVPGALLTLAPDQDDLAALRTLVRQVLALREVQKRRASELSAEDRTELERRLREKTLAASDKVVETWRHLALWMGFDKSEWSALTPSARPGLTLSGAVREHLAQQDRFTEKLSPDKLRKLAFGEEEKEKTYREIWGLFLSVPDMPILTERTVREALREGVRTGALGLKAQGEVYWNREVADALLDDPEIVVVVAEEARKTGKDEPPPPPQPPPPPTPPPLTRYRLRVKLPWDRVGEFLRGVVVPLGGECERLELEVSLDAEAQGGLSKGTLEHKVRETLRQLGISVIEERLE